MDQLRTVEDIDGSFVPMPRADVVQVFVGSELVLVRQAPHVLNPTASLVWSCFDGRGDLDEIIDDLAAATGADADEVRSDVLELTRRLARHGCARGRCRSRRPPDAKDTAKGRRGRRRTRAVLAARPRRGGDGVGIVSAVAGPCW